MLFRTIRAVSYKTSKIIIAKCGGWQRSMNRRVGKSLESTLSFERTSVLVVGGMTTNEITARTILPGNNRSM